MNNLTGGIVVYIVNNNEPSYFYAENSFWLLDDWYHQIIDLSHWKHIAPFKMDLQGLPLEFLDKNLPQLILDFDQKKLINNYYDQAFEERIPKGWTGIWMEDVTGFLDRIPEQSRYWLSQKKPTSTPGASFEV